MYFFASSMTPDNKPHKTFPNKILQSRAEDYIVHDFRPKFQSRAEDHQRFSGHRSRVFRDRFQNRAIQMSPFLLFSFFPQNSNFFDQLHRFLLGAPHSFRDVCQIPCDSSRRPNNLLECSAARCCTRSRSFTCMASTACSSFCSTT